MGFLFRFVLVNLLLCSGCCGGEAIVVAGRIRGVDELQ